MPTVYSDTCVERLAASLANAWFTRNALLFNLPDIGGGVPSAATLWLYCQAYTQPLNLSWALKQGAGWDESSDLATLNALSGDALGSGSLAASISEWVSFDITGDATKGIIKAYADSASQVTILLDAPDTTPTTVGAVLGLGETTVVQTWHDFLEPGDLGYEPYLEIVYSGGVQWCGAVPVKL